MLVGDAVPGAVAGRLLGVSHTVIARWLDEGELLRGRTKRSEVERVDLLDVAERVRRLRKGSDTHRHVLAAALRGRLSPGARIIAAEHDLSPALLAAWARTGAIRAVEDPGGAIDIPGSEANWMRSHAELTRVLWRISVERELDTLVLFGSTARGEDIASSDVDLLAASAEQSDLRSRLRLQGTLSERLGQRVDITSLDDIDDSPSVVLSALVDGRVIRDATGRWKAIQSRRSEIVSAAAAQRVDLDHRHAAVLDRLLGEPA